jgi:GxxExxY protein
MGLGSGFLVKIYENPLACKLRQSGLIIDPQRAVQVAFEGQVVGTYVADLIGNKSVLLDRKAADGLNNIHTSQGLNRLKPPSFKSACCCTLTHRAFSAVA